MLIEGRVGGSLSPTQPADGSTGLSVRQNREGTLIVGDGHARYQEVVSRGGVFLAANSATQALSVNSTTATGLILTNPWNSNRNLVILEICVAIASLPAGQSALILTGNPTQTQTEPTHTTPLTVRNALVGSTLTGVGKVDSAATIGAATIMRVIGAGTAATVAASTSFPPFIRDEVAGLITLSPGTCISLQALTTAMTVVGSIMWEEVAV
jgi:hypothetical protein